MFLSQTQLVSELHCISRVRVLVNGKPATDHDARQFQSVTVLRYGLESDLLGGIPLAKCSHRRVIHNLAEVDLRKYAEDFKVLKDEYLSRVLRDPGKCPWPDFKRRVAGRVHYPWLLVTMANLFDDVKSSIQWLTFDERLLCDTDDDVSAEIQSYLDFEESLRGIAYPEWILDALNRIVVDWMGDFTLCSGPVQARFGPGSVSELRGRPPILRKACELVYDQSAVSDLSELFAVDPDTLIPGKPGDACWENRIIFRPKNALKHRIISAEPTWLSWLQQSLKGPVYDYVNRHHGMFTDFSNQARSRELALRGSADGSYATVDFSNASDSVTLELVTRLFAGTELAYALPATRSRMARMPDGRTVELKKFAPMGSACCFFAMDILFLSICELAVRLATGRKGRPDDYVVYGDDVIIRSDSYSVFSDLSAQLKLSLNSAKSFADAETAHFYRESCGIEAYDGVDVTPFRYSRFQEPIVEWSHPADASYVTSVVDMLNRLQYVYAYYNTRSALWQLIQCCLARSRKEDRSVWDHIMRIDESDYAVGLTGPIAMVVPDGTATNYRCRRRWHKGYQREEILCSNLRARAKPIPADKAETVLWLWSAYAEAERPPFNTMRPESLMRAAAGLQDPSWVLEWHPV